MSPDFAPFLLNDGWTEADTEEMAVALAALSAVGKPVAQ